MAKNVANIEFSIRPKCILGKCIISILHLSSYLLYMLYKTSLHFSSFQRVETPLSLDLQAGRSHDYKREMCDVTGTNPYR